MCQTGAYGMAFRGWTYDRILKHYYTGVELQPMVAN
jgi:stage II sporulation protein D